MENKNNNIKLADARIVQAVRKLKSSKEVDQPIEVRKNQDEKEIKNSKNLSNKKVINNNNSVINKSPSNMKKVLTPINQAKQNNINVNNNNLIKMNDSKNSISNNSNKNIGIKKDLSKSISKNRLTIDGSIQKPNTSSTNKTSKTFDYETLKKYKKRQKSDYQKNLLSKKSIDKYKEECINLIKKESEIKDLLAKIGINKDEDYLIYINNTFFSKPHFLFSLEILIMEAVEEANTLKVFRTNKNVLPLKVVKENFFRDEIIKDLRFMFSSISKHFSYNSCTFTNIFIYYRTSNNF